MTRASHLRTRYGITEEQYDKLLQDQNERCALCDRHYSEFKIRLAVDHDHSTGEIRGALCNFCNRRLIGRHRDGALLRRMAEYVERHTGWFVPPKIKRKRTTKKRASSMAVRKGNKT